MQRYIKPIIGMVCFIVVALTWFFGPNLYDKYALATASEKEQWAQMKSLYDAYPPSMNSTDCDEFIKARDAKQMQQWADFNKDYAEKLKVLRASSLSSPTTRVTRYIDLYIDQLDVYYSAGTILALKFKQNTNDLDVDRALFNVFRSETSKLKKNEAERTRLQEFIDKNFVTK